MNFIRRVRVVIDSCTSTDHFRLNIDQVLSAWAVEHQLITSVWTLQNCRIQDLHGCCNMNSWQNYLLTFNWLCSSRMPLWETIGTKNDSRVRISMIDVCLDQNNFWDAAARRSPGSSPGSPISPRAGQNLRQLDARQFAKRKAWNRKI